MSQTFTILPAVSESPGANRCSWPRKLNALLRYPFLRAAGYPRLVNLEVTQRCNARCDFCRYWMTRSETVLDDYSDVVRRLKPAAIVFTGGEALLRPDLVRLVAGVRKASPTVYLSLVTNGWLLTVPRAAALQEAGLDQFTISLDFLDERHDRARGIRGLARRIQETVPAMVSHGLGNIVIQVFIRRDNLDAVIDVVDWARAKGVSASVSTFTSTKAGVGEYGLAVSQMPELRRLVERLLRMKQDGWPIVNSTYFLSRVPEYFENGGIAGCPAGRRFVTVNPGGGIQRCSEMPVECGFEEWQPGRFGSTECGRCWVPCRGENQAPLNWEQMKRAAEVYSGGPGRLSLPGSRELTRPA